MDGGAPLQSGAPRAATPPDDDFARKLRGFGPVGILAALVILLIGNFPIPGAAGLLVLLWARLSRTPWSDLGLARPKSWWLTITIGVVLGAVFKLVMKAVVMPLLGADPINHAFHFLEGNTAALPMMLVTVIVAAGFGEEMVFRGFAFERLGKLIGRGTLARVATVLFTSVWFGLEHLPGQGVPGAQQATIVGLVVGTLMMWTRNLPLLMITHAVFDITAVAIIYWGLETRIAHLIFK